MLYQVYHISAGHCPWAVNGRVWQSARAGVAVWTAYTEGVTLIGTYGFKNCPELEKISLPSTLTMIGYQAFSDCPKLQVVDIPEKVNTLGVDSFSYCTSLKEIIIRNPKCEVRGIPSACTIYGYKDSTAEEFAKKYEMKFVDITTSSYADTSINDSVKKVPVIESTAVDGSTVLECGDIIFGGIYNKEGDYYDQCWYLFGNKLVLYDHERMNDWIAADQSPFSFYKSRITDIVIDCYSVGAYAFTGFTNLKNVTILSAYDFDSIGESAFEGCTDLETIILPSHFTNIGKNAFKGCSSLKQVTLLNVATKIDGDGATISNKLVDGKPVFTGTIYGTKTSKARDYAEKYGYNFVDYTDIVYTTTTAEKPVVTTTTTAKPTTTTTKPETTTTTTEAAATTTTTSVDPATAKGDLNHDGETNVADLVFCQRYVLGIEKTTYNCDYNGDGVVDVFDIIAMRKLILQNMSK